MARGRRIWTASLLLAGLPLCADTSPRRERFDPSALRLVAKIEYDAVHTAAFSPDGLTLAVSTGVTVRMLNAGSWGERRIVRLGGVVRALAYSPDSRSMLVGGPQTDLRAVDLATGRVKRWWAIDVRPTAIAWTSRFVALGGPEGIDIIDPARGSGIRHSAAAPHGPFAMAVAEDGARAAAARIDGACEWYDSREWCREDLSAWSVAYAPGAPHMAIGRRDGQVWWWSHKDASMTKRSGHGGPVHAVVFSRAHQLYVSAGGRTVRFWRASDFENVATLPHAGPEVDTLAVSPDGRWLVTATTDGVLRVYGR